MSRTPRIKSQYLHLIVRGIGKQLLFEDDSDRWQYLKLLQRFRDETGLTIIAYCLMENHVHLLVDDKEGQSALFMKKLGVTYAHYFNCKYERTGHLFQDRYKSEVIEDERYYLTVFRYILNNPVKAGICAASEYKWSSYKEYGKINTITNTMTLQNMIGEKNQFDKFLAINDTDECMEYEPRKRDDQWALQIIHNDLKMKSGTALQKMPREERNQMLVMMKKKGLTVRQIERLTGINRGVVQMAR